ncbi:MAG: DUF4321 domain-containing protein [Lachnospiraceae bacterium]|nr:DUF4321 domain-containing protein [Lachnospiraceae bacterium]
MKRINWTFVVLVLIGFVIGRFIGTYFGESWLNYGQTFGFSEPLEIDLGFLVFVIGFQIRITIASVLGVILSLLVYKFVK